MIWIETLDFHIVMELISFVLIRQFPLLSHLHVSQEKYSFIGALFRALSIQGATT
jgi:hypothetical protein